MRKQRVNPQNKRNRTEKVEKKRIDVVGGHLNPRNSLISSFLKSVNILPQVFLNHSSLIWLSDLQTVLMWDQNIVNSTDYISLRCSIPALEIMFSSRLIDYQRWINDSFLAGARNGKKRGAPQKSFIWFRASLISASTPVNNLPHHQGFIKNSSAFQSEYGSMLLGA